MRVAAIYMYPVKSCAALSLPAAELTSSGIENDRRFAFVTSGGRALTQRDEPRLATVRASLEKQTLQLDLGGLAHIEIPFQAFSESTEVDVWGKRVPAHAASDHLINVARDFLGIAARMVALAPAATRALHDAQPVLVTATTMLSRLNEKLAHPVGMERFRPNVIIENGHEGWRSLRSEEVILEKSEFCGRCEVTTIDQASGERRGDEPLRTLEERFGGNFGVYCRVTRPGRLARGEALRAD